MIVNSVTLHGRLLVVGILLIHCLNFDRLLVSHLLGVSLVKLVRILILHLMLLRLRRLWLRNDWLSLLRRHSHFLYFQESHEVSIVIATQC